MSAFDKFFKEDTTTAPSKPRAQYPNVTVTEDGQLYIEWRPPRKTADYYSPYENDRVTTLSPQSAMHLAQQIYEKHNCALRVAEKATELKAEFAKLREVARGC